MSKPRTLVKTVKWTHGDWFGEQLSCQPTLKEAATNSKILNCMKLLNRSTHTSSQFVELFMSSEGEKTILQFLKANVQKSSHVDIESQLKTDFLLAKKKSKKQKQNTSRTKKIRTLTRKEKKTLGFYRILRNSVKYEDVLPMHGMWTEYLTQMLELDKGLPNCNSKSWEQFTQTLYKSDFHGSFLCVVRSKCPSYVGKSGICIMDTKNTFKLVSKDNVVTTVPKFSCVFEMRVKNVAMTLFGKHLCVRPAERSTKKVKSQLHPDLI